MTHLSPDFSTSMKLRQWSCLQAIANNPVSSRPRHVWAPPLSAAAVCWVVQRPWKAWGKISHRNSIFQTNEYILVRHLLHSPPLVASICQSLWVPWMLTDKKHLFLQAHDMLPDVGHAESFHQRPQQIQARSSLRYPNHFPCNMVGEGQSIVGSLSPDFLEGWAPKHLTEDSPSSSLFAGNNTQLKSESFSIFEAVFWKIFRGTMISTWKEAR